MNDDIKFVTLWCDDKISLKRLADIYHATQIEIVERGEALGLDGKLGQSLGCHPERCWYYDYCKLMIKGDRVKCEGGEPVPYVDPGYDAYRSSTGNVIINLTYKSDR